MGAGFRSGGHLLGAVSLVAVSPYVVKQMLKKHRYVKRTAQKKRRLGDCPQRDEQFQVIAYLKADYLAAGYPVISIDAKKKELLGQLYRAGRLYTLTPIEVFDHDYAYLADGVAIPYTIYDLRQNKAYVYLGTSKDTAQFVADCLRHWWQHYGQVVYPSAPSILVLADGGGSNSARHYIFKSELQQLADQLNVEIRLAHYPPYCSKWNPIEHRVFPHLTRAMQGVAHIVNKIYETDQKVAADFKETMRIVFDKHLPQWNYRAVPLAAASG